MPGDYYHRVRDWKIEPPSGDLDITFIALRRRGNDGLLAAIVSFSAPGQIRGWKWLSQPTHWLPLIPK